MRDKPLTAMNINIPVFTDVVAYSLADRYCFGGTYALNYATSHPRANIILITVLHEYTKP
jgi:hypothetical protein